MASEIILECIGPSFCQWSGPPELAIRKRRAEDGELETLHCPVCECDLVMRFDELRDALGGRLERTLVKAGAEILAYHVVRQKPAQAQGQAIQPISEGPKFCERHDRILSWTGNCTQCAQERSRNDKG